MSPWHSNEAPPGQVPRMIRAEDEDPSVIRCPAISRHRLEHRPLLCVHGDPSPGDDIDARVEADDRFLLDRPSAVVGAGVEVVDRAIAFERAALASVPGGCRLVRARGWRRPTAVGAHGADGRRPEGRQRVSHVLGRLGHSASEAGGAVEGAVAAGVQVGRNDLCATRDHERAVAVV